jgi:hypothetical protein
MRNFVDQLAAKLAIQPGLDRVVSDALGATEPTVLEEECSVVGVAATKAGPVGLDADTGRPMQLAWDGKYEGVDVKPVIINAGAIKTMIPPRPAPPREPAAGAAAVGPSNAMKARFQPAEHETEADVRARRAFAEGCLANPAFYAKREARLGLLERGEAPAARPAAAGGRRAWPSVMIAGNDLRRHTPAIRSDDRAGWRRVTMVEQSAPAGARRAVPRQHNGLRSHARDRRGNGEPRGGLDTAG